MVNDGKNVIFTDAICFHNRISSFIEGDPSFERQMTSLWPTLLGGPALLWWNGELTSIERNNYRAGGIYVLLSALRTRFTPDAAMATQKFTEGKLTLYEIASDDSILC